MTEKVMARKLELTFACALEGKGEKCPKNPPFSCISPPPVGVCNELIAVDELARSLRRSEEQKETTKE